jgi:hypothetical protein
MGGHPGEECLRARLNELRQGKVLSRLERLQSESGQCDWVPGNAERSEYLPHQHIAIADEGHHELLVSRTVPAQRIGGLVDRNRERCRRSVVEWVSQRYRRLGPGQSVGRQRQRAEERGGETQGVDRRAGVVQKARERQLERP